MKISDLPKEYREIAEKNRNSSGQYAEYVQDAFVYIDTEQGYDFWKKVETANTIEELPKIENL